MFNQLFKPKWQHQDERIRQQALASLSNETDHEIIAEMAAGDPSPSLRKQALAKLQSEPQLRAILETMRNPDDWLQVATRMSQLGYQGENLAAQFFSQSPQWQKIETYQAIANCDDMPLAQQVLNHISNQEGLIELAIHAQLAELRVAAAEKIDEPASLQKLLKLANYKPVIKSVKAKLNQIKAQQKLAQQAAQKAQSIISQLQKMARTQHIDAQYPHQLKLLNEKWQALCLPSVELAPASLEQLGEEYHQQVKLCQANVNNYQQQIEQAAAEKDARQQQQNLCRELTKLIAEMEEPNCDSFESIKTVEEASQFLLNSWQQTVLIIGPLDLIAQQFERLSQQLNRYFKAWRKFNAQQSMYQSLFDSRPTDDIESQQAFIDGWKELERQLNWPEKLTRPAEFANWQKQVEALRQSMASIQNAARKQAKYISKKLAELARQCTQKNLIAANKLAHYIELKIESLNNNSINNKFKADLEKKLAAIRPKLEELRDWHQFVANPKKEALCEAMEKLVMDKDKPLARAKNVNELQQQWRQLTSSDPHADEQLWQRFKQASDQAYAPCLKFYHEQDQIKAQNLNQRVAICEQLNALINEYSLAGISATSEMTERQSEQADSAMTQGSEQNLNKDDLNKDEINKASIENDTKAVIKKLDKALLAANKSWKKFHPVPENEKKRIQQHFNFMSKTISEHLKQVKQANQAQREALVQKARALVEQVNVDQVDVEQVDVEQAIKSAIKLQQEWKEVGITFYKADREQWHLFRSEIDKIFAKREAQKQAKNIELESNLQRLQTVIDEIQSLQQLDDNQLKSSYEVFENLKQSIDAEIMLPNKSAAKWLTKLNQVCDKFTQHYEGINQRQQQSNLNAQITAIQLLHKAEQQAFDLEASTNNKIADAKRLIAELSEQVNALALSSDHLEVVNARLDSLKNTTVWQANKKGTSTIIELCLELEIMLEIDSPQQFKSQRMALQLDKLQQGFNHQFTLKQQQSAILEGVTRWLSSGFIAEAEAQLITQRMQKIISAGKFN